MLIFEYDPLKSKSNKERHGIDFEEAQELWKVRHVIISAKVINGEARQAILGILRDQVWMAIFAIRDGDIRLISCHRADDRWRKLHEIYSKKKEG